jgi:hypothetical protein
MSDGIRAWSNVMEEANEYVAGRLPLAEAVLQTFAYLTEESFLAGVYDKYRGRSYEWSLSFANLLGVITDALLEHEGCAHRALKQAQADEGLPVSQEAWYGKLRRIPEFLSQGFLLEGTQRLLGILPTTPSAVPKSVRKFDVRVIDGKKLKNAAKRLKPTRSFRGSVLGGKVLVALDLNSRMAIAMSSHEDGETNDCPLVPELLEQLRGLSGERKLLCVLDSQFSDLKVPALLAENEDHFLMRYHPKVTFSRDSAHPVSKGKDREGRWYEDERGWLGKEKDKRRRYVRRITLKRPGEEALILITDLLDEVQYSATDLLDLYRMRWGIENVFQRITEVFHLRELISSTPKGTIFQCAFCLLLYNLIELERAYLAVAQRLETEQISMENLFYSAHRQLIGWTEVLPTAWTVNHFQRTLTATELIARLHHLLDLLWKDEWLKSPKKKFIPKKQDPPTAGGHTSVYRLLRQ